MSELHVGITTVVSEPDPERAPTECPRCGYDAVVLLPVHMLTDAGVGTYGDVAVCVRCYAEEPG